MDDVKNPMPTKNYVIGPADLRVRQCNALPLEMRDRTREICNFAVEPAERNKGYGTRLLRKVCAEADAANIILVLWSKPFDTGETGLALEPLVEWYNRFGFAILQTQPEILMARMPHAEERVARLVPIAQAILKEYV